MNNELIMQTENNKWVKLGEIKEMPSLETTIPDEDLSLLEGLRYHAGKMVTLECDVVLSKPLSKSLHYIRHSKKYRVRKKHINRVGNLFGVIV